MLFHRKETKNGATTWQRVDYSGHVYGGRWGDLKPRQSADSRPYYCDNWPAGWRDIGDVHDVLRRESRRVEHTGWYADSNCDALVIGRVLQLPARNGKPVYISGVYNDEWDGVTIYPLDRYDNAVDAARMSDEHARIYADECRQHDAEFQAEQQIADKRAEIVTMRTDAKALIREIKAAGKRFSPAICAVLREKLQDIRRESRAAYRRIADLESDCWQAVQS